METTERGPDHFQELRQGQATAQRIPIRPRKSHEGRLGAGRRSVAVIRLNQMRSIQDRLDEIPLLKEIPLVNAEKIITTIAVAGAGFAASKALSWAWKFATGHNPPTDINDDGEVSIAELAIFAAVSGALVAIVQAQANKGAKKWISKPQDI